MEPTTLRLPEGLAESLAEEADELGYSSRSEYIRHILRNRTGTEPNTERNRSDTGTATSLEISYLADRLNDLEARLEELEATGTTNGGADTAESIRVPTENEDIIASDQDNQDTTTASSDSSQALAADVSEDVVAAVEDVTEQWEDAPDRLRTRKIAAAFILQHAIEAGDAVGKSSEVVADVREEYPVEGQTEETFWRKNIRPVLKEYGTYNQGKHGYVVSEL